MNYYLLLLIIIMTSFKVDKTIMVHESIKEYYEYSKFDYKYVNNDIINGEILYSTCLNTMYIDYEAIFMIDDRYYCGVLHNNIDYTLIKCIYYSIKIQEYYTNDDIVEYIFSHKNYYSLIDLLRLIKEFDRKYIKNINKMYKDIIDNKLYHSRNLTLFNADFDYKQKILKLLNN